MHKIRQVAVFIAFLKGRKEVLHKITWVHNTQCTTIKLHFPTALYFSDVFITRYFSTSLFTSESPQLVIKLKEWKIDSCLCMARINMEGKKTCKRN